MFPSPAPAHAHHTGAHIPEGIDGQRPSAFHCSTRHGAYEGGCWVGGPWAPLAGQGSGHRPDGVTTGRAPRTCDLAAQKKNLAGNGVGRFSLLPSERSRPLLPSAPPEPALPAAPVAASGAEQARLHRHWFCGGRWGSVARVEASLPEPPIRWVKGRGKNSTGYPIPAAWIKAPEEDAHRARLQASQQGFAAVLKRPVASAAGPPGDRANQFGRARGRRSWRVVAIGGFPSPRQTGCLASAPDTPAHGISPRSPAQRPASRSSSRSIQELPANPVLRMGGK